MNLRILGNSKAFLENILLHASENSPLVGHGNRIAGEQEHTVGMR